MPDTGTWANATDWEASGLISNDGRPLLYSQSLKIYQAEPHTEDGDVVGWRSHVDRINPGTNAADIPGQGPRLPDPAPGYHRPLSPADDPDKTYTMPPDAPVLTHPPGATPPGHIPLNLAQETNMPTDPGRMKALDDALALGGTGEVVLTNAQAFYLFLSGGNDAPPAVGPAGEKGEKGDKGDKGDQGIQGIPGPQGEPAIPPAPSPILNSSTIS